MIEVLAQPSLLQGEKEIIQPCTCPCRCSEVSEEAAALRVLLADLSLRHVALQRGRQLWVVI